MTLQIKAALLAAALTVATGASFYLTQKHYSARLAAAEAKTAEAIEASRSLAKELELHRVLVAQKNASTARLARSRGTQETRTAVALAQNPAWAVQPIPETVLEALNVPLDTPAGSLGSGRLREPAPESGQPGAPGGPSGGLPGQEAPAAAEPGPGAVHPGAGAGTGELQRGQGAAQAVPGARWGNGVGPQGDGP